MPRNWGFSCIPNHLANKMQISLVDITNYKVLHKELKETMKTLRPSFLGH